MDEPLKINKNILLITILLILIPCFYFLITKVIPDDNAFTELNTICMQVQSCNSNLEDAILGETIDFEKAESILATNVLTLQSIKSHLFSLNLGDSNEEGKQKLIETIDLNIDLYNITSTLIRDPQSDNISTVFSNFNSTLQILINNYEVLQNLGLNISFSSEGKDFFYTTTDYINVLIKISRESDIKNAQKTNYILSLKSCLDSLDSISEDLKPTLESIRYENRSLDILSTNLKQKRASFNTIKTKTYSITIPENSKIYYDLLVESLAIYDIYLTSLESAVSSEKSLSLNHNDKTISSSYDNSFFKYDDFKTSLTDFKTELDKFNSESI